MLNEFRQDLVSGQWVLLATSRSKRPHKKIKKADAYQSKDGCPFEDLDKSDDTEVVWKYPDSEDWQAIVIKNKFPAVKPGLCSFEQEHGPFKVAHASGNHDIIVYKNHDLSIYSFTQEDFENTVKVYKRRYSELIEGDECAKYVLMFHNHGEEAGASIYHPHSQMITMPILPPDVFRSVYGAFNYYQTHKKRVYDDLLAWEQNERARMVYENKDFLVFCPFASKHPYEVRIFSKEGHAHFHQMPDILNVSFADALRTALRKLNAALDSPAFNMFIHTAPIQDEFGINIHEFYHWHVEIIPHLKIDAGFEIGTGVDVNTVNPDDAADALRKASII